MNGHAQPNLPGLTQGNLETAPNYSEPHYVSLEDNKNQEIDNPLAHLPPPEIRRGARKFARRHFAGEGLADLFEKAALVARDPLNFRSVPRLTRKECNVLARESTTSFWSQSKALRITIVALGLSAVVQGWIQTNMNGSNLAWPAQFGLAYPDGTLKGTRETWIFASVNAITYLAAGVCGCWLSDPLNEFVYGRRGAIFLSAIFCFASVIGGACTHSWKQLFACRFLLGIGMGTKASVTPIWGAEVSPAHLRGSLVMNWQLLDTVGIFFGFSSNLVVSRIGPLSWRFQFASAFLPTIPLMALVFVCPESPRFLLKRGRYREAYQSLLQLREIPLQAAKELYYMNCQIQAETKLISSRTTEIEMGPISDPADDVNEAEDDHDSDSSVMNNSGSDSVWRGLVQFFKDFRIRGDQNTLDPFQREVQQTSYWTRFAQLFRNRRTRRATVAAAVVMTAQQLCGVNVLVFYSSTFFRDYNSTSGPPTNKEIMRALWLSWGIGLANFLFTFPTYYFIDKRGRRFLLLLGFPAMAISMLIACLSFNIHPSGLRDGFIILFIFAFFFFYSWSEGPVAFAYSSEVFPLLNREVGMSFAVFCNLFGAGILTLFVPSLTKALGNNHHQDPTGQSRTLAIFAGLNIFALILIFFFVPETAGATLGKEEGSLNYISLEELNYIFSVRTRKHMAYQVKTVVPWAWKYYIRRREEDRRQDSPEQLYNWVRSQEEQQRRRQPRQARERISQEERRLGGTSIGGLDGSPGISRG